MINAEKAKEVAEQLFPEENWIKVEEEIYLSTRRAIGRFKNGV